MNQQATFAKWNRWLDRIYGDVQWTLTNRYIYTEVQKIVLANPKIRTGSAFYEWMGNVYATTAAMGVRRQLDERKDSVSLARLLGDMDSKANILSRGRYIALWGEDSVTQALANRKFDKLAGKGQLHVPRGQLAADLSNLKSKARNIKKYATKLVAHADKSRLKQLPTYRDLNDCLDHIEELTKKCFRLLRAVDQRKIVPMWLDDWKEIFHHAWIQEE